MLMCKEISKLVSESLDRKLPLRMRMEVRLHLMMCSICRNYRKRLLTLREIIKKTVCNAENAPEQRHLSPEAEARIKSALRDAIKKNPSEL